MSLKPTRKVLGDGKRPPLGRPPKNRLELERLIDYLADPKAMEAWLKNILKGD